MQNSNSFQQLSMAFAQTLFFPSGSQHPSCGIEVHGTEDQATKKADFGSKVHALIPENLSLEACDDRMCLAKTNFQIKHSLCTNT